MQGGGERERRDGEGHEIQPAQRRQGPLHPREVEGEAQREEREEERAGEGARGEEGHPGQADRQAEGVAAEPRPDQGHEVRGCRHDAVGKEPR
jgi:hypothetical protein